MILPKICDNPSCSVELGEIACGSQMDDGSYCSAKCASVGKINTKNHSKIQELHEEILVLERKVEKYKRYLKESEDEKRKYLKYKNAFQCLLKELGLKRNL